MSGEPSRGMQFLGLLAVTGITVLVYAPVSRYGFVNQDDPTYILLNPHVQHGLDAGSLSWAMTTLHFSNWHPLTWISYLADISIFGIQPGPMHLINLLFHLVNTTLLVLVLHRMTGAYWPSLAVGAAFALHPLHVESVAWVSERKDVLSTMFWLAAMFAYWRYTQTHSRALYAAAVLAFGAGLMAKPMVITLPCVLLLCDFWPLRRNERWARLVLEKIPFFVLSAASAAITIVAQHRGGAIGSVDALAPHLRAANAIAAYGSYLWKTVCPLALAPFYPHPGAGIAWWKVALSAAVLGVISAAAWRMRKSRPYVLVGWLWFLGTLVPVIGLLQVGSQAMADRYTYIPLIGIFIAVAWLVRDITHARPALQTGMRWGAIAAFSACALLTVQQIRIWENSVTLFSHALAVTPRNSAVHTNLGVALAEAGRPQDAIPHFEAVLRMQPDSPRMYYNLALAYNALGNSEQAEARYRKCLEIDPNYADAANNLGMLLMARGQIGAARACYHQALAAKPGHLMARVNLGDSFAAEHRWEEAAQQYQTALDVLPDFFLALCRMAAARLEQGRPDDARRLAERAASLNPNSEELQAILRRLGT